MLTGLIVALLVSTLQFFVTWHKRDIKYDTLLSDIQNYVSSYFADLKSTTDDLQPLVANSCQQVAAQLTSSAAFSLNVRAFLLVKRHCFLLLRNGRNVHPDFRSGPKPRYQQKY